ncbi:MAG: HAD hydrolase-like protein, partial [Intestinibacter sp.]|uniref:HAD hydrolase-like protein n=1 Tax=Intestinibacter sp. TaxID=1965304 RepID=UPI0025C3327B
LKLEDFDYVTTFENSHYCKPNLDYYREIFEKIGSNPNESIMVGNNALEDMISGELGVKTYLVTDNLENPNKVDIDQFENGSFDFIAGKILEVI